MKSIDVMQQPFAHRTKIRRWVVAAMLLVSAPVLSQETGDASPPDSEGKRILQVSCTTCHDLTEVTKFKGFYDKDEWRDIVMTMIEYGAKVEDGKVAVLVDYLAATLGKSTAAGR